MGGRNPPFSPREIVAEKTHSIDLRGLESIYYISGTIECIESLFFAIKTSNRMTRSGKRTASGSAGGARKKQATKKQQSVKGASADGSETPVRRQTTVATDSAASHQAKAAPGGGSRGATTTRAAAGGTSCVGVSTETCSPDAASTDRAKRLQQRSLPTQRAARKQKEQQKLLLESEKQ